MISDIYRFKEGKFDYAVADDGAYTYRKPGKLFLENAPRQRLAAVLKGPGTALETWKKYISPYLSPVVNTGDR
jgi:hypothetical protein